MQVILLFLFPDRKIHKSTESFKTESFEKDMQGKNIKIHHIIVVPTIFQTKMEFLGGILNTWK